MDAMLLVLGLLKLQDMHGYQLGDLIDKRLGYLTDLKKPTLYHLLGKLESKGMVTKTISRQGNRPERFTYRLTASGRTRFHQLLEANLAGIHQTYFADDLGLLFLSELPAADARRYLVAKSKRIDEQILAMEHAVALHKRATPAYFTLRHHLVHLETERAWLAELLGDLKKHAVREDILECLATQDSSTKTSKRNPKQRG